MRTVRFSINMSLDGYCDHTFSNPDEVLMDYFTAMMDDVGGNMQIVRNDPAGELLKLKQQPGNTILTDSVSMLPEMIAAGLIDEFNLVIHPVIVGNGRHMLDAGSLHKTLDLELADTINLESGCTALHYVKR